MKMIIQHKWPATAGLRARFGLCPERMLIAAILFWLLAPAGALAQESCLPPFDAVINNQELDDVFPGVLSISGLKISVTGKLTINQSIALDNVEFVMNPNSSVDITGLGTGVTASNNTRFHGCTQMWNGISVKNGAIVQFDGVHVDDAWQGLIFLSAANTTSSGIKNSFFYDNVIGIGIYGIGSAATPFRFTEFSNNRIDVSLNPLLPPPSGRTYSSSIPLRGIWITQSVVDLVSGVNAQNRILKHRYGMAVFLSTVTMANFKFDLSRIDPLIGAPDLEGTDIYSYQSTLTVGGNSGITGCIFSSAANAGIISNETRGLSVSGASFSNPNQLGISCINSIALSSPILIVGNTFTMNGAKTISAIRIDRPPSGSGAGNTLISGNEIEMFAGHQKKPVIMIDVVGQFDATDLVTIQQNMIDIDVTYSKIHGIHVTGKGDNYQIINDNQLSWEPASNPTSSTIESTGIMANDLLGTNHLIVGNNITSKLSGDKSFLRSGIDLSGNALQTYVCENEISRTHFGVHCAGTLSTTFLKKNIIGDAAYGLDCQAQTSMPTQNLFENVWTGAYANWGAIYEGGSPSFGFVFDPSPLLMNDLPPSVSPPGWFTAGSGSNSACGSNQLNVNQTEQQYIDGALKAGASASDWDTRRLLLYKMLRYPQWFEGNKAANDYLRTNENAHTSAWQYARAEWLFDHAYTSVTNSGEPIGDLAAGYCRWSEKIRELDALQTTGFDRNIAQERRDAFTQLSLAAENLEQARAQTLPDLESALQTALTYCRNLPETTDYERNLKNVLTIAIRHAMGDSPAETDFAILRSIAAQCPETGGASVRRAPLWLPHEEYVYSLGKDWNAACRQERSEAETTGRQDSNVVVAPNPAADFVQVSFPAGASGAWYISNITGSMIQEGQVSDVPFRIGTADWPEGLYFLNWQSPNQVTPAIKLMISHR